MPSFLTWQIASLLVLASIASLLVLASDPRGPTALQPIHGSLLVMASVYMAHLTIEGFSLGIAYLVYLTFDGALVMIILLCMPAFDSKNWVEGLITQVQVGGSGIWVTPLAPATIAMVANGRLLAAVHYQATYLASQGTSGATHRH